MQFENIKPGDTVLRDYDFTVIDGGWGTGVTVTVIAAEVVAKVTKTQATTVSGIRFTLDRGSIIGQSGVVYPEGFVSKRNGNVMTPTPAKDIEALNVLANEVKRFKTTMFRVDQQQRELLKAFIRGKPYVLAALELQEISDKLADLLKGAKK